MTRTCPGCGGPLTLGTSVGGLRFRPYETDDSPARSLLRDYYVLIKVRSDTCAKCRRQILRPDTLQEIPGRHEPPRPVPRLNQDLTHCPECAYALEAGTLTGDYTFLADQEPRSFLSALCRSFLTRHISGWARSDAKVCPVCRWISMKYPRSVWPYTPRSTDRLTQP